MQIISPMLDVMFKRMFSLPDSKPMLCDFLSTFIEFKEGKIDDVKLIDKEIRRTPDEKNSILDLRVEAGNTEIDIEVQLQGNAAFNDRMAYYLSKMFADQLGEKDGYETLHKCVSLCILNFSLFKDEHFYRTMLMRDIYGNILTDKMEFDCIEVSKIRNMELKNGMSKKMQWAKLLAAASEEELNMVKDKANDPVIDQAVLTVKKLSADRLMRLEAEAREKAYRDNLSFMQESRAKGMAEGRAEGRAEAKAMIAENLRAMGLSEEQIKIALSQRDE